MANYWACLLIFRIFLPAIFGACVCFRPSALSAIYFLFLIYLPLVPVPTRTSLQGHTGIYLKILIGITALTFVSQFVFQIVLLAIPPYGDFLKNCEFLEKLLRHVGFVKLDEAISVVTAIQWLSPEIVMLITSIGTLVVCNKLCRVRQVEESEEAPDLPKKASSSRKHHAVLVSIGKYCVLFALCFAAVLRPSITGGLYFLVFLSSATWWACYKELRKGFAILMRCLMVIVVLHMAVLYAYQFQWPQEYLESNSTYARYFGLTPILTVNCTGDPRDFYWAVEEWATYVNPSALFLLYYILALESKVLLKPQSQKKQGPFSRLESRLSGPLGRQMSQRISNKRLMRSATTRHKWQSATRKVRTAEDKSKPKSGETTPLIRGVSPASKRYGSGSRKTGSSILQDSTGSVTVTGDNPEDIAMDQLGAAEEEYNPTVFENVMLAMETLLQFIIRSSYIATNIIMMAWSITYLSWIAFVLLLWANLLWLVPNQRKSMLRSSPFLVLYAWFLLISAYIYSMNLTDDELPSAIQGFNLAQIGFQKVLVLPCNQLMVKCLFTGMFWITLRQYMQERLAERQSSALADMVAPLQVTVGTATGVNNEQEQGSKIMERIGVMLRKILTRCWIWIVAITLFAVAITGERMTGFRIVYMALFLFFILSFQLSLRAWRRMMFGFWLTVIVYSMIILVMVYTYQFDNFKEYWSEYLHVPEQQQLDIGLEKFETKQLFVRLVTPTFFVIITVIQLHYFHKDFMILSDPKNAAPTGVELDQSSLQGGAGGQSEKDETTTSSIKFDHTDTENSMSRKKRWYKHLCKAWNLTFVFLELHLPKVVLFVLMLMCVYDDCSLCLIPVVLIVLALTTGRPMQLFAIYTASVFASLMLLSRMIYQIEYIEPTKWNVTCEYRDNSSKIENNPRWFGFTKTVNGRDLPDLVKWNLVYVVIVTLWSVVQVRQYNYRVNKNRPTTRAFFMFPRVTRTDADKNLPNCLKYLFNYGFYKFGVEVSLMMTVALIGYRMDLYAVIYSVWLCILFNLQRSTLAKVWNIYMGFIAVLLPLQYIITVGLPPTLCITFPWDSEYWPSDGDSRSVIWRRVQDWAYLLDGKHPPNPKKIICDFILLLMVSRQSVVFRIERRHQGQEYSGGSNESIIHHMEEKRFLNPVPDFITYVRTYLDILKRSVCLSYLWLTLTIVFLAGTNRVNIFSIGYLCGAFIFLWQGSDLYLRPIPKILKAWNMLLGYNVAVIMIKAFLQILGCVFVQDFPDYFCWPVQVFGIGCVKKFGNLIVAAGHEDINKCDLPRASVGLVWDGMCFGFLIMQRRIFNSYNFFHVVNETKAATILASRGAELIEELRQKRMTEQEDQEHKVLEKIKMKMDRIKANQQRIQGTAYKDSTSHYVERPPLAHTSSMSSCASASSHRSSPNGYHTPIDDEEPPEHPALTPRSSLLQQQAPSPYSAVMTVSLEGYLEPQRMSFGSPPNSDLNPRPPSPDDSFPVFSPPPYDAAPPYAEAVNERPAPAQRQTSIGPPWMQGSFVTPRQSVISYSSRSPLSHHNYTIFKGRPRHRRKTPTTYKDAIRSGDYYMFDDLDDDEDFDLIEESSIKSDEDDEELKSKHSKPTIGELLSTAMKTDISTTVRHGRSDTDFRRRLSMPVSRQKSVISARSQLSVPFSAPPTIEEHTPRSVTIVDDRKRDLDEDEPQPGTSKDEEISEMAEPKETWKRKFLNILLFIWAFIESMAISCTNFLNRHSKDYRYVLRVLAKEKRILKENTEYSVGLRLGTGQVWQPAGSYHSLLKQSRMASADQDIADSVEKLPLSESSDTKALATTLPYSSEQDSEHASQPDLEEYDGTEMSSYDQPTLVRLVLAVWFIMMSHSELFCYFVIFLNQIKSATFLSLPLPLMVFLWGTLTTPRPSKTFWVTIIAYTQVIVLIKCMFQFDIIPWNRQQEINKSPFYPPRILGIERNKYYAIWDFILLLIVFFHRSLLKSMGLWKASMVPAAVLVAGDYRVTTDGKLSPVESNVNIGGGRSKSKSPADSQKNGSGKDQPGRKDSDLQRLVEESEEPDEIYEGILDPDLANKFVSVHTEPVDAMENFPQALQMALRRYGESFKIFFKQLIDPTSRVAVDVYSYMFLCDFFNFFVILIGYSSFNSQQGDDGVQSYLEDNRIPPLFLLMLVLQFLLIIVDRGIFLRKNILGKTIFQFIQIVFLHIWLFIVFPVITEKGFNTVIPPQMYYMVKSFYLLLSAYQIRCGYPTRILGNFLCKGYNYVNMILFKVFMAVPFLFELRTIMDWMWTDTSMTVFDWIKMEDIFAHIFQLKCSRHVEDEYPQPRGERKKPLVKYFMGGFLLFLIISIIWFPLVFFSVGNAVGEQNLPFDVTVEIRIGPYEPVYQMSAQSNSIFSFSESNLEQMKQAYITEKSALYFISNYEAQDIAAVKLSSYSANVWSISPPDRQRMVQEVNSTSDLSVRLEYRVSHKTGKTEDSGVIPENVVISIPAVENGEPNPIRTNLLEMLLGKDIKPMILEKLLPKFLKVTNKGTAASVPQLMQKGDAEPQPTRTLSLVLNKSTSEPTVEWWKINEDCNDTYYKDFLSKIPFVDCDSIIVYTFNDKKFPQTLTLLTGGGIVGLYTTLVFVAWRFLRGFFAEQCFKIMFEDLPNIDRVIQLCLDIYLVREAREFTLEEDLFAKLVFLFRSPETLIKWTRPKEEIADDEDPEGEDQ